MASRSATGKKNSTRPARFRKRRAVPLGLGLLVLLLFSFQYLMEPVLIRFVNRKLDEIPGYRGHVEDIDIHLWRGAYSIEGVRLQKLDGSVATPFLEAKEVDLSVEWLALFHGKIVSEITLDKPVLTYILKNIYKHVLPHLLHAPPPREELSLPLHQLRELR